MPCIIKYPAKHRKEKIHETVTACGDQPVTFAAEFCGVAAKVQVQGRGLLSDLGANGFGQVFEGMGHTEPRRTWGTP